MHLIARLLEPFRRSAGADAGPTTPEDTSVNNAVTTEQGQRATPENQLDRIYRQMYVDPALRAAILDIRKMDKQDGRVKKIHNRLAREAIKGGVTLTMTVENARIMRLWKAFRQRLGLDLAAKLKSDARGLAMEGNLPMQWVLDASGRVAAGVRMPAETIIPLAGPNGRFNDPQAAYRQMDLTRGVEVAKFALWQLTMARLEPDNHDDLGCLGRPYLDASRECWLKLRMTDKDLVIRRKTRAPLRMNHVLEGATDEELQEYRKRNEGKQGEITTDFYSNKKGAVNPVQGDAKLDEIADVVYLLDTFLAGSPLPKGLLGYTDKLSRDVLEDLKRDFYEEVDTLQEALAGVYEFGFRLELLLAGIDPYRYEFAVQFAERRTETRNQKADLALKYQAMSASPQTVLETAGLDPAREKARMKVQTEGNDPYPEPDKIGAGSGKPNVNVTPGNERKGESATTISTRS